MTERQIPLPLEGPGPAYERADFLIGAGNRAALAMLDKWPDWPDRLLLLIGPKGSGKSHLGEIWRRTSRARLIAGPDLVAEAVPALLEQGALLVDKADEVAEEPALFHLINLARECGTSVLLLSREPPEAMDLRRPDLASRLCALPRIGLSAPDEALLSDLLVKRLSDRQIGPVPQDVLRYVIEHIGRSHDWVERAARVLDEESLGRRGGLTLAAAKAALARLQEEPVNTTDA